MFSVQVCRDDKPGKLVGSVSGSLLMPEIFDICLQGLAMPSRTNLCVCFRSSSPTRTLQMSWQSLMVQVGRTEYAIKPYAHLQLPDDAMPIWYRLYVHCRSADRLQVGSHCLAMRQKSSSDCVVLRSSCQVGFLDHTLGLDPKRHSALQRARLSLEGSSR